MRRNRFAGDALYVAWKLNAADAVSAQAVLQRLGQGESRKLYLLRSWVVANGEARALLQPDAPLERITEALWDNGSLPGITRWVEGRRACALVAWEIERVPVTLGLAARPEQWPFSSAAGD